MNRTLLSSSCIVLSLALLSPQIASAQLSLGFGGGIVSSTLVGDDTEEADPQSETGINVGAFLAVPLGSRVSFVPGAYYVQKGASFTEAGVGEGAIEVSYFEIPLLLSVAVTPDDSSVGFSIFGGPSIAFESGCTISASSGSTSISEDCDPADEDERQTLDVGAMIGAGAQFPVGERFALMVSGGADLGLRTLDSGEDPEDIKHRAFFGSVSLVVPLGG